LVEITRLAREMTPTALQRFYDIMMNDSAPFRDQVAAACAIADRGCGRPVVGVVHGSSGSRPTPVELI
jgi:hypothetical protein